jgi:hypothetical protein
MQTQQLCRLPGNPILDSGSAQFWFGRINLSSTDVQPPGTIGLGGSDRWRSLWHQR